MNIFSVLFDAGNYLFTDILPWGDGEGRIHKGGIRPGLTQAC